MPAQPWFAVRNELTGFRATVLTMLSFLIPIGLWCLVSYNDNVWHPYIAVDVPGGDYKVGDRVERDEFPAAVELARATNARVLDEHAADEHRDPQTNKIMTARQIGRGNKYAALRIGQLAAAEGWLDEDTAKKELDCIDLMVAIGTGNGPVALDWFSDENAEVFRINAEIIAEARANEAVSRGGSPTSALLLDLIPDGHRANPIYLPAPDEVASAFVVAFLREPRRQDEKWMHERLLESLDVVVKGFGLALIIGLPLGLLCGTFNFFSRLIEPFFGFFSYLPPPAFGALLVAIWGLYEGPKVAMVFIAAFFPLVLMIAKTTRLLQPQLLEAAQVLGADRRRLVTRVVLPSALPNIYNDLRILLACAWTILIIAEVTGEKSGISAFINTQGRYRIYENVFAAIVMIGLIGLFLDRLLAWLHPFLFPWQGKPITPGARLAMDVVMAAPRGIAAASGWLHKDRVHHRTVADIPGIQDKLPPEDDDQEANR